MANDRGRTVHISRTASYVWNPHAAALKEQLRERLKSYEELAIGGSSGRIVELLKTPQTVETIRRVLTTELGEDEETSEEHVQTLLASLYEEDLIQMSPDT
jgi:hypothetical protein